MSQGRGTSDAVRDSISTWITPEVVDHLWAAYPNKGNLPTHAFRRRLQEAKSWVRRGRSKLYNGWERPYECKEFPDGKVGLTVRTDLDDEYIRYVTFQVDGKVIGGGMVNVPSVLVGGRTVAGTTIKNGSFTAVSPKPEKPTFVPFTPEQILQLQTKLEYGDDSVVDRMFEERV